MPQPLKGMSAFGGKADMKSQFMAADHRALKSAIACLRVVEYP